MAADTTTENPPPKASDAHSAAPSDKVTPQSKQESDQAGTTAKLHSDAYSGQNSPKADAPKADSASPDKPAAQNGGDNAGTAKPEANASDKSATLEISDPFKKADDNGVCKVGDSINLRTVDTGDLKSLSFDDGVSFNGYYSKEQEEAAFKTVAQDVRKDQRKEYFQERHENVNDAFSAVYDDVKGPQTENKQLTSLIAERDSQIQGHKAGDTWTANGTEYKLNDAGGLVQKNKDGVTYIAKDGSVDIKHGKEETFIKPDGREIKRTGDGQYEYRRPDGSYDKVDEDDQTVVHHLDANDRRVWAQTFKDRPPLTGAVIDRMQDGVYAHDDAVTYIQSDDKGNRVIKDSKGEGALFEEKNGANNKPEYYKVVGGKVYKFDLDHRQQGEEVHDLPPGLTRNADGSIQMKTVRIGQDNNLTDSQGHISFNDRARFVTGQKDGKEVRMGVDANGTQTFKSPDVQSTHTKGDPTYVQTNPATGKEDLKVDFAKRSVSMGGVTMDDKCTHFDDGNFDINNDMSVSFSDGTYWDADYTPMADYYDEQDASESKQAAGTSSLNQLNDATAAASVAAPGVSVDAHNIGALYSALDGLSTAYSNAVDVNAFDVMAQIASAQGQVIGALAQAEASKSEQVEKRDERNVAIDNGETGRNGGRSATLLT